MTLCCVVYACSWVRLCWRGPCTVFALLCTQACEHAARLAALPSMLTGTFTCGRVERDLSDEAASITGYLGWVRLLEAGEHTETSVAELHELCLELQEQLIRRAPKASQHDMADSASAAHGRM
jgi:hypothetical protein